MGSGSAGRCPFLCGNTVGNLPCAVRSDFQEGGARSARTWPFLAWEVEFVPFRDGKSVQWRPLDRLGNSKGSGWNTSSRIAHRRTIDNSPRRGSVLKSIKSCGLCRASWGFPPSVSTRTMRMKENFSSSQSVQEEIRLSENPIVGGWTDTIRSDRSRGLPARRDNRVICPLAYAVRHVQKGAWGGVRDDRDWHREHHTVVRPATRPERSLAEHRRHARPPRPYTRCVSWNDPARPLASM